ncbi:MAG: hypothetical protein RSB51_03450 [Clostridia bacterium]
MKNVKMKKAAAAILAATLVAGTAGILINKSDASFKFVAEQQGTYDAAKFAVEIYELGNASNKIKLDGATLNGDKVEIPVKIGAKEMLPNAWIGKGVNIKNNSSVPINVKVEKEEITDKTVSSNLELSNRLDFYEKDNELSGITIKPGENKNVSFDFKFRNTHDFANKQGADNPAINGEVIYSFKLDIAPSK